MAQVEIKAVANRGTQYTVTFQDGRPYTVCVVYRKYATNNAIQRQLWQEGDPKMSLTVACAVRAAQRIMIEKITNERANSNENSNGKN